jgi:ATP-dependent RNA helicase DDX35
MINYGISFNTSYIQVGITEPRRVAATTLAARVAEEKNCNLGDLVGYSIRFDECFDRDRTKIKFMTEGILVREMLGDPLLKAYSVLILDEVHERTAQIDIIMGLLKKVMRKRRDLKVIISSATVDAEYIRDFFNYGSDKGGKKEAKDRAAILSVEGTNYSVDVHYLKDPCPDYVKCCF